MLKRLFGGPAGEPLLDEIRAGGAAFTRVVFTRNRRVMVSVGDNGATVRLHECFRDAPPDVLRAVGRVLAPGRAGDRAESRDEVRRFLAERIVASEPARPRAPRRVAVADRPDVDRLIAEFDAVNRDYFGGSLPRVPISLSGRMRRRNGHFTSHPLEIVISRRLCRAACDGEAEKTLRHEMIHLWQYQRGGKPGHGADFRHWAARLGIHPRATREVKHPLRDPEREACPTKS